MTGDLKVITASRDELNKEITERKRAEELLSENEGRLKRSQEIAHLGGWELDLVDNILTWSDEVYRIFGLQPQEFGATYEAFLEAVHPDDRAAVSAAYSGSLREGRDDYEIEHRVVRKSTGEIRYVHEKCQHFRDETGRIIRSVGMVHDITERKKDEEKIRGLNEELKHKVVQLESANQELEAFSYSVSHDLRSPLRSIDGFSLALLEDYAGKLDAEGRDHLDRVRGATRRMAQLIDDLLKLSRVTRMEMKRERVNLSVVATQIAGALRNSRPDRTAEFMVADDLIAFGDERLLTVALENLFANAWKFAEKKPQTVIEFGATLLDGKAVYFVRDNGAGFDMAYADKLFSPFQRLHQEAEFSGTGIGLATVKRIVNRHGGRVWIEGEVEKGATVYFTL
jgi:PAS domain S-box-containing protein